MAARTRTQMAARAAGAARLPAQKQKQAGIQGFARAAKAGAREGPGKGALSLKRKLGEVEEGEGDVLEVKVPKLEETVSPATKCVVLPLVEEDGVICEETTRSKFPSERSDAYRDLIFLHSSFVKALSLHFSHNGATAPANVNGLYPTLERIWKKRKVTIEDIQRLLYIQEQSTGADDLVKYQLSDDAKTCCVERVDSRPRNTKGQFNPPVDESELTARFAKNLEDFCQKQQLLEGRQSRDTEFMQSIPLATIHKAGPALNPRNFVRQQLLDIGTGSMKLKAIDTSQRTKDDAATARESKLGNRKSSLLQRIQAKSQQKSRLPPPPSKETSLRRAAVQRVPEVVNVLLLLTPAITSTAGLSPNSLPKKPFRWETIVQNIQDSAHNPVSKSEVEACLDLLSQKEVAGDWIQVITLSRFRSVVLRGGLVISPREIIQKVEDLNI